MLESEKNVIQIHDLEPSTMEALLKYMYHGRIDVSVENVQTLLQGASMLNLVMLRNICCQFLQLHIDASNCLGWWLMSLVLSGVMSVILFYRWI